MTPFVPTRDDLIGFISDGEKEIWGFRPGVVWANMSYAELDAWGRKLSSQLAAHRREIAVQNRIQRKIRHAAHVMWVAKKKSYFTAHAFRIGDLVAI